MAYLLVEIRATDIAEIAVGHIILRYAHTDGMLPHQTVITLDRKPVIIRIITYTTNVIRGCVC